MQTLTDRPPPLPSAPPALDRRGLLIGRIVTALLVVSPFVALGVGMPLLWGHLISLRDVVGSFGNGWRSLATGTGQDDLAAPQNKGIFGAQACLQSLALWCSYGTYG